MKPLGQIAYEAFESERPWLVRWSELSAEIRQKWNDLANATADFSVVTPSSPDPEKEGNAK